MRHLALLITSAAFIAASNPVFAAPLSPAGVMRNNDQSAIVLVQDKPKKDETIKQKVKRVWRNLTGYKFAVSCPALPIPLVVNRTTCTETGKSREEARAKCQSRHPFCAIGDAK